MDETKVILTICGMGVVTYLPRLLPMFVLSGRQLAPWLATWLSFVPATVLAALLLPELLCRDGRLDLNLSSNYFLVAALPALLVAWHWRSFFGTVAVGMTCVALLRFIWGG